MHLVLTLSGPLPQTSFVSEPRIKHFSFFCQKNWTKNEEEDGFGSIPGSRLKMSPQFSIIWYRYWSLRPPVPPRPTTRRIVLEHSAYLSQTKAMRHSTFDSSGGVTSEIWIKWTKVGGSFWDVTKEKWVFPTLVVLWNQNSPGVWGLELGVRVH